MTRAKPSFSGRRLPAVPVCVALTTIAGSLYVFFHDYPIVREVVGARGEQTTYALLGFLFPLLSDLGMVSAALWIIAAAGLYRTRPWAASVVSAAALAGLIATFMPIPPTIGRGHIFPSTVVMALPAVVAGFLFTARRSLGLPWKVILLGGCGLIAGLFCFIIGVASTHRFLDGHGLVYVFAQRLHWMLLLGWLAFVAGWFSRRPWALVLGMGLASVTALVGTPVCVADSMLLGRFSAFGVTPVFAALLGIGLAWNRSKGSVSDWAVSEE